MNQEGPSDPLVLLLAVPQSRTKTHSFHEVIKLCVLLVLFYILITVELEPLLTSHSETEVDVETTLNVCLHVDTSDAPPSSDVSMRRTTVVWIVLYQ